MRTWRLEHSDPLALRIAADVRLIPTDYADDQIWELDLAECTLSTRYGGRGLARLTFDSNRPAILHEFYPNYLRLGLASPAVFVDIWLPSSQAIAVRISPPGGASLSSSATCEALEPTLLSGSDGRYVFASRPTATLSRDLARSILSRSWDTAFANIREVNGATPEIHTGDPDWDAAFAFAYKASLGSFVGPTPHLPHPSFIFTRIPERGYSPSGDGSDHNWQWDGQVATEAYVCLPLIATAAPELAKGVLRNYLAIQASDGFIDWKPGLAGQRNGRLCIPLLTAIAWHIYLQTEDREFLQEVHEGLVRFLSRWYEADNDRDVDGIPEWSNTIQSAFDDQPTFVRWRAWGQAADISAAETPDLMAYLYRAHRDLQKIERTLGRTPDPVHETRASHLAGELEGMWRSVTASFHFRDRDSHTIPTHTVLLDIASESGLTAASHPVSVRLPAPNRVLLRLERIGPGQSTNATVSVEGYDLDGRRATETISSDEFAWYGGLASASGRLLWSVIERIHATGLDGEIARFRVSTPDLSRQDQTLLLPLWAGMLNQDRARTLVKQTIIDPQRYWRPYGMPNCSALDPAYSANNREGSGGVWMMWNTMIGEGLVTAGYREVAADLIGRLMTAMVHTLKTEKCFREAYNPDVLQGLGDRDYLWGVAPCYLFLQAVGIRIVGRDKVYLAGYNPFPWAVTVEQNGVSVTRPPGEDAAAEVIFPEGVQGKIILE
jgi:hypothetical protein